MTALHLDLDGAWSGLSLPMPTLDLRKWGPQLRYCTTAKRMNAFYDEIRLQLPSFLLYGSGDFHHLTALWLRGIKEPFTLISFDNHPDWDRRPPLWQCGAWINRALALSHLSSIQIWTPASPDVHGLGRRFANQTVLKTGRLKAFPYEKNWLERFKSESQRLSGQRIYVTIDLDCLKSGDAVTNWDQGEASSNDIAAALGMLRENAEIIGGDICGAWSEPVYERMLQRFAAKIDHPPIKHFSAEENRATNFRALHTLWPALIG